MRRKIISCIVAAIGIACLCLSPVLADVPVSAEVRIAVFPFTEQYTGRIDPGIPAVLDAGLAEYDFIRTVPVEIVQEEVYDLTPEFLWTGVEGGEAQGGILWRIEPEVILRVGSALSADYSIYGDTGVHGDEWTVNVRIFRKDTRDPVGEFSASGSRLDERPGSLKRLAEDIAAWLRRKYALTGAEETVRRYLGHIIVHGDAIQRISDSVSEYPDAVPLRALLLDLYLRDREHYENEILKHAVGIMSVYQSNEEEDTRYLLSLSLDPYDVAAQIWEKRSEWANAIQAREEALKAFPFKEAMHREYLGKDYFQQGIAFEQKRDTGRALASYEKALTYLDPSSEYASAAAASIRRIKDR